MIPQSDPTQPEPIQLEPVNQYKTPISEDEPIVMIHSIKMVENPNPLDTPIHLITQYNWNLIKW